MPLPERCIFASNMCVLLPKNSRPIAKLYEFEVLSLLLVTSVQLYC